MIIQCDASQLEWRCAVFLAQEKEGLKEILAGVDLHDDNRKLYKLGEGKEARTVAKRFLFKLIYGASAFGYANDPEFTHVSRNEKYWQKIIDATYEKYQDLRAWHVKLVQEAIETGKVVIPSGREYHFTDPANPRTRPQILNYPCQGFGAEIVKIARISAFKRIRAISKDILFVNTVHDSKVNDSPAKYLDIVAQTYYDVYESLPENISRMFKIDFNVPLACEVTYGPNLGEETAWRPK
jgi:DNA polymerase I